MKSCLLGYPVPKEPHKLNTPKLLVISMPKTGFFFPGTFHIPHPEDGERKIYLNGCMDTERTSSVPQASFLRIKSGGPSTLGADSVWVAHSHLMFSSERRFKGFSCSMKGK
jgi:hypothetical protein